MRLVPLLAALLLAACTTTGAGAPVVFDRTPFDRNSSGGAPLTTTRLDGVFLRDGIRTTITVDPTATEFAIEILAQENIEPIIRTEILEQRPELDEQDILLVELRGSIDVEAPPEVTITTPPPFTFVSATFGTVATVTGIDGGTFRGISDDGAVLAVTGTCADGVFVASASEARLEAGDLVCETADIVVANGASATVHATDSATADISGDASLTVRGGLVLAPEGTEVPGQGEILVRGGPPPTLTE
jgi:hypothetical protein